MKVGFLGGGFIRGFVVSVIIPALGVTGVVAQASSDAPAAASVKITQPYDHQEFLPGEFITISAEAFNPGGEIHAVEIYSGTNLVRRMERGSNQSSTMKALMRHPIWRLSARTTSNYCNKDQTLNSK